MGAVLIALEGLVDLLKGVVFLVLGRPWIAVGAFSQAVLFVILGLILGGFTIYGRAAGGDRSLAAGVVLIVVSLLGLAVLGFTEGLLVLLGAVLVLIAGVLFLVTRR
ncbi:MAG: hypothetical protein L3K10_01900 [Thermoplasmata archaeon]|nr:hypothetical protein [Thermoplasmata archaeon]